MNEVAINKVLKSFEEAFCDIYKNREAKQLLDSWIKGQSEDKRNIFRRVLNKNGLTSTNFSRDYETIVPTTRGQVLGLIAAALTALMSIKSLRTVVAGIIKEKFRLNRVSADVLDEVLKLVGSIVPTAVAGIIAISRLHGATSVGLKERPRLKGY